MRSLLLGFLLLRSEVSFSSPADTAEIRAFSVRLDTLDAQRRTRGARLQGRTELYSREQYLDLALLWGHPGLDRLLSREAELDIEDTTLSVRYGDLHPDRVAAKTARINVAESIRGQLDALLRAERAAAILQEQTEHALIEAIRQRGGRYDPGPNHDSRASLQVEILEAEVALSTYRALIGDSEWSTVAALVRGPRTTVYAGAVTKAEAEIRQQLRVYGEAHPKLQAAREEEKLLRQLLHEALLRNLAVREMRITSLKHELTALDCALSCGDRGEALSPR